MFVWMLLGYSRGFPPENGTKLKLLKILLEWTSPPRCCNSTVSVLHLVSKMQRSSQLRWNSLVWWKHGPPSPLKYTHTYTAIPHTRRLTPQIWHTNVPSFSFREISCKYSCLLMHLTTLTSDEFHLDAVCARCFLSAMSEWKPQSWAVSVRVWVTGKINPTDNRLNFITLTHCFPTIRIYSDFSSSHINRCLNHC